MALNHLSKKVRKIGSDCPWGVPPDAILAGLVACALLCCMALLFSLWHIRHICSCVGMVLSNINHPHMLIQQNPKGQHYDLPQDLMDYYDPRRCLHS